MPVPPPVVGLAPTNRIVRGGDANEGPKANAYTPRLLAALTHCNEVVGTLRHLRSR
jgi:hypothetical protein